MPESYELRPGQTVSISGLSITLREGARLRGDERIPKPRAEPSQVVLWCPIFDGDGEGGSFHVRMGRGLYQRLGAPLCPFCKQRCVRRD